MLFRLLVALAIGLPLGAWTAAVSIRSDIGVGALTVGTWTAWPLEGSREADPYTKAKVAARGSVPLGVGEGVAFEARTDAAGRPLDAHCNYRITGRTPKARVWTLTAHEAGTELTDGPPIVRPDGAVAALTSRDLVRAENGTFTVSVGPTPTAGDWIALPPPAPDARSRRARNADEPEVEPWVGRPLRVVLRFYDSPVATSAELFEPTMPTVERRSCA